MQNKKIIKKIIKYLYNNYKKVFKVALSDKDLLGCSIAQVELKFELAGKSIFNAVGESQTKCDIQRIIKFVDETEVEIYKIKSLAERSEARELFDFANDYIKLSTATKFYLKAL